MDGLAQLLPNFDWWFLLSVIPILICITIHELAHGLAALALGDDTAKQMGRLTLNPIRHIDPVGFLMLLVVRFGWAKPVPVDMRNFQNPKLDMALTALAGPMSNFLLAAVIFLFQEPLGFQLRLIPGGGMLYGVGGGTIAELAMLTAIISVHLGVFNLLPIPPLDGSKIVFALLPDAQHNWLMRYERYGFFVLLALIWLGFTTGPMRVAMGTVVYWIFQMTSGISVFIFG